MDKNTITGLLLIGALIIGYSIYTRPSKEDAEKYRREQDSIALVKQNAEKAAREQASATPAGAPADSISGDSAAAAARQQQILGSFATAASGKEQLLTIENELLKATLSTKGGKIVSVQLKEFKTFDGRPLILFKNDAKLGLHFTAENRNISTDELYFQPEGSSFSVSKSDKKSISMKLAVAPGKYIEYLYTLAGNSYDMGFTVNIAGLQNTIAPNTNYINLSWRTTALRQEKNAKGEKMVSTVYYKYTDEKVDYLTETEDTKESLTQNVKWVAFKQQFFTSVLIAGNSFTSPSTVETVTNQESQTELKHMTADLTIPFLHKPLESFPMQFYFGPNHYQTLKEYDLGLEKQIPLGWGIFGWVNRFIVITIFNFLASFNWSYGLIILILTIVIKVMLLPLTFKAYLSQAKMKVLKPEVDEIQSRKDSDPLKTQQEMMSLYKKAGVNPLGGCLPMLLQLPILIAMFRFFPASIELRQQSFLWAEDLSTYDSILDLGFNIPGYGDHVSLFTLLMTISTLIYTRMNNQFTGANAQMKWISYLMPIMFLGFFNDYSSGLSYYYFLANVLTFGQQYLFRYFVDEKAIHLKIQENKKKPVTKSKLQLKMEEMAKAKGQKPKK
jgi:YidC/Oxa1 family membrane protein insertase